MPECRAGKTNARLFADTEVAGAFVLGGERESLDLSRLHIPRGGNFSASFRAAKNQLRRWQTRNKSAARWRKMICVLAFVAQDYCFAALGARHSRHRLKVFWATIFRADALLGPLCARCRVPIVLSTGELQHFGKLARAEERESSSLISTPLLFLPCKLFLLLSHSRRFRSSDDDDEVLSLSRGEALGSVQFSTRASVRLPAKSKSQREPPKLNQWN